MMLYSLAGILGVIICIQGVSDWGVWRGMPLEVGRVMNSLPCSEPLLRLASAHGWDWYQAGGSQSEVSTGRYVHELRVRDGAPVW